MSVGLNKTCSFGKVGGGVELLYTPRSPSVTSFRLSTTSMWTIATGKCHHSTEWFPMVVWSKPAEFWRVFSEEE